MRALLALLLLLACLGPAQAQPDLKSAFRFKVGAALNEDQFTEGDALVEYQFNSITPENVMKWESLHPDPDEYDFEAADRYVAYGQRHGMFIVGHTLVWDQQTPEWVFEEPINREILLERMRAHIHTVVGRYRGRIAAWDVVNEALGDDGSLLDTPWRRIIGDDYVAKAFEFAREADPGAALYYNDYKLELPAKRAAVLRLLRGLPVTGVGVQAHYQLEWPAPAEVAAMLADLAGAGYQVAVSELDIDVQPGPDDPYRGGLPAPVEARLTQRYAELFAVFVGQSLQRVTFWGVADGASWLNWYPEDRTNHPLLFDREGCPKPAFWAVLKTAR